ncbi:hypothetical protein ACFX16_012625 [Malus domestica]
MPRHSKSQCFQLIRYLDNWDKTRDPHFNKPRASVPETKDDSADVASKASDLIAAAGTDGHLDAEDNWLWN